MDHGPGASGDDEAHTLSSLLSMLNNKEPGSSITCVVNATTIDYLCSLLYPEGYVGVATRLSEISDVLNLLDFIFHLLRDRRLPSPDATTDFNRRARRLMFKIISTNPVMPRSLIVTEVKVPAKRDYIGGGAFGGVFKGELRGEIVALKVLYRTSDNVALTWAMLTHKFVLSFMGIYEQQDELFLVSPYMENGTLAQWRKNAQPPVNETWERILEVAQGMEYIHSEDIVHGDLRGDNILLDANLHIQIADFGLTRLLDATNTQSGAKHLNFSAPELFGCLEDADNPSDVQPARTQMSDVYAFGCLCYEIHYDSIPFVGRPEGHIVTLVAILDKHPDRLDEPPLSDGAWEVIQQCWTREPLKRQRMKDVIESLISAISWQSISLSISARVSEHPSTFNSFQEPRRRDTRSFADTSTDTFPLDILLKILRDKQPDEAMTAIVSPSTIRAMSDLLSTNDYVKIPSKIKGPGFLKSPRLHFPYGSRRARRLMIKLALTEHAPAMPQCLLINKEEVKMNMNSPAEYRGFANVDEGSYRGIRVTAKRLRGPFGHGNFDQKHFLRELLTWRTLSHGYVLPFVGIYEDSGSMHLVSPFMENGTLSNWRKEKNPSVPEVEIKILRVAEGVQYLHYERVIHCDLRGSNVLLDSNLQVRIADFGLSRDSNATSTIDTTVSKHFAAPELLVDEDIIRHTEKTDIYAFGCLYYEIHFNSLPFGNDSFYAVQQVKDGKPSSRRRNPPLEDEAWNLIERCWDQDPGMRPSIDEVVEIMVS